MKGWPGLALQIPWPSRLELGGAGLAGFDNSSDGWVFKGPLRIRRDANFVHRIETDCPLWHM